MGYIYKIINDINNKVYIGLTNKSNPIDRWTRHLQDYNKYLERPLYRAMNKYGVEHFHFEVIEETDKPAEREQYWISKLRTYIGFSDCNGYNATLGGDGVFINTFENGEKEFIIELYQEGLSCNEIAKQTNHSTETISNLLKENGIEVKIYLTKVGQYTLEGEFLRDFPSAKQASEFLGKTGKGGHIIEVCKGQRKTAYGYKWKYI